MRILLDNACGRRWTEVIAGRPAYARADATVLGRAIALGEAGVAGDTDLGEMNARSLAWRGKRRVS